MKTCKQNECPVLIEDAEGNYFDGGDNCCMDCEAKDACEDACGNYKNGTCEHMEEKEQA